jgi:NTE family protein
MRALVLSGGGSKGAYEVGVIKALVNKGCKWDVIAGISVGALNGTWMAMHSDPVEGAQQLERFWLDIKNNKSIYKNWWCGPLGSLFYGGAFNTQPLRKLIQKNLDTEKLQSSGIKLMIGSVSLTTGEYRIADNNTPDLDKWVMASSAFPLAFPPEHIDDQIWIDGGVRNVVKAYPEVDVIDVVVATNPDRLAAFGPNKAKNALLIGSRCIDLMSDEIIKNDIIVVDQHTKVNVYMPDVSMRLQHPLTFDPAEIRQVIDIAYDRTMADFRG